MLLVASITEARSSAIRLSSGPRSAAVSVGAAGQVSAIVPSLTAGTSEAGETGSDVGHDGTEMLFENVLDSVATNC
jgi:hypothetical protein